MSDTVRDRVVLVLPQYRYYREQTYERLSSKVKCRFIFVRPDNPDDPRPSSLDSTVIGVPGIRIGHYKPRDFLRLCRVVWREIRADDIGLVVAATQNPLHSKVTYVLTRIARVPFAVNVEQWMDPEGRSALRRAYDSISTHILRHSICLVHGERAREYCLAKGAPENRVIIWPHCSNDLALVETRAPRSSEGPVEFLSMGRVVRYKALDVVIRAFVQVRDLLPGQAHLNIAGEGPHLAECRALAESLGMEGMDFLGRLEPRQAARQLAATDVLVYPSSIRDGDAEGWGLTINEALSLSVPVIVSDAVGCVPDLVTDGVEGRIVARESVDELAAAMVALIEQRAELPAMGARGRATFERYNDFDRVAEVIGGLLRD